MNEIDIQVADWQSTEAIRHIRHAVFVEEQKVPADLEWDADDPLATHFLMRIDNQAVGTARLLEDGHIGRVAILADWRGKGLGNQLMSYIMQYAKSLGMRHIELSAQTYARDFYLKLGFQPCSDEYMEAGIPHIAMAWDAPVADELPPIEFTSPGKFSIHNPPAEARAERVFDLPFQLGEQRDLIDLTEQNANEHLCWLITQARRQVTIYAADQAIWLFNRRDVLDCMEQLIARQPKSRVRILIQEASQAFLEGHSLLTLMHRFPSTIEIRRQHPERTRGPEVYMLVDDCGILMLPRALQREGFVRYNSPDQVKRWGSRFDELWSTSQSDSAIRRFML